MIEEGKNYIVIESKESKDLNPLEAPINTFAPITPVLFESSVVSVVWVTQRLECGMMIKDIATVLQWIQIGLIEVLSNHWLHHNIQQIKWWSIMSNLMEYNEESIISNTDSCDD